MGTFPMTTVESGGNIKAQAYPEMMRLWDERTQFTRSELGDAPGWAKWVDRDGDLFDAVDEADAFDELIDSTHPIIRIEGVLILPSRALATEASDYKYKRWRWLGDLVAAGHLRKVVDDERA